jgi:hypothetical protein
MKGSTAVALVAVAVAAIMYFWPSGNQTTVPESASENASGRDSLAAPSHGPTTAPPPPALSARTSGRVVEPGTVDPSRLTPLRIDIRAPDTVRSGDTFPVTIDVQAFRGIRQLAFSVTYKKSILQLVGSSPGAFAQQGGNSVQFEESSDGHLLVRIDLESGVIAGAGSIAVLEFRALRRGVSPLSVQDVTHIEVGGQDASATPTQHERSITVD